ncbi:MAG: glycosyltransferase family 9 protein [Fimbriimonadaceae bacterium]|nr:glycosyltransferase family 9 protein [Fimbriimonadaceae bacterium]
MPRVLVVRFSAIGDCVMAAWAVTALRRAFPEGHIVWAAQERCAAVVADGAMVDQTVVADRDAWKKTRWSPATWWNQTRRFTSLRRHAFEFGFDLQGHSKTALCLRLAGARERHARRATDALARKLNPVSPVAHGLHEVEANFAFLNQIWPMTLPDLPTMPELPAWHDGGFVSIQTGAGSRDKTYPVEQWRRVAEGLVKSGCRVVAVGGARDPGLDVPGVENLVGRLGLTETMQVVRASALHVAADTGTGHIAAAYGVPVVSVFGPTNPGVYRPWSTQGTVLQAGASAGLVSPKTVVEAAVTALEKAACAR